MSIHGGEHENVFSRSEFVKTDKKRKKRKLNKNKNKTKLNVKPKNRFELNIPDTVIAKDMHNSNLANDIHQKGELKVNIDDTIKN